MDLSSLDGLTPEQLAQIPAMMPPGNLTSNFDNPPSIAIRATVPIAIFLSIMTILVAMRMYSRLWIIKRAGPDDWTALLAGLFAAGLASTALYQLSQGWFGPHTWNIRLIVFLSPTYNRLIFVLLFFVPAASFLVKVSILLFIRRIFPRNVSPKTAYAIWAGLTLNILAYTILIIYTGVVCGPRPSEGGQLPAACTARNRKNQGIASASLNASLDLYVLAIAIPPISALKMARKKKIGIISVLCVGLVAFAFSLISLYYRTGSDYDPAYNQTVPLIFTVLEPVIGVITACLPAIPALWVEVSKRTEGSFRNLLSRMRGSASMSQLRSRREYANSGYELSGRSMEDRSGIDHQKVYAASDLEETPIVPRNMIPKNSIV
ncbi:hypothetical protein F5Y12DRAFT_765109 [Xylaria sp. FL1777]|nr:hypothetical protein F5Y12DRAFT_765109 [Xylaria sp. FL1777]